MSKKLTTNEFIIKAKKIHDDKYDYSLSDYKDAHTKIKITCNEHGIFEQKPNSHLSGSGCLKCGNKIVRNSIRVTTNEFINNAKKLHGNKYDYSLVKYINNKNKIKIICNIHGEFEQQPSNHLFGAGCNKCGEISASEKNSFTITEFITKSMLNHGDKYDYSLSKYVNKRSKLIITCPEHGIFKQRAGDHMSGYGCPICNESKGERRVRLYLTENNIKYIRQKTFKDCKDKYLLKFDFYLPEYNMCIEYDGEGHFIPIACRGGKQGLLNTQKKDRIKTNYCIGNKIPLIRISYKDDIIKTLKNIINIC